MLTGGLRVRQGCHLAYLKSPPMYFVSGGLPLPPDKPSSRGCARPTSSFYKHNKHPLTLSDRQRVC